MIIINLGGFLTSALTESLSLKTEWQQVSSGTLFSILASHCIAVVWMVSTHSPIFNNSPFLKFYSVVNRESKVDNYADSLFLLIIIRSGLAKISMSNSHKSELILFTPLEFFTSLLADGFSMEFEWQQVSSSHQDSSQYSGRFQ